MIIERAGFLGDHHIILEAIERKKIGIQKKQFMEIKNTNKIKLKNIRKKVPKDKEKEVFKVNL